MASYQSYFISHTLLGLSVEGEGDGGGSRSWGGGGAGDGVKDTSRAPLCKGSGLIPNVSTGVMSLKSVFSACGQAS